MSGRFTNLPERLRASAAILATGDPLEWTEALTIQSQLEDAAIKIESLERESASTPDPAQIRADALRDAVGKYVIDPQQPAVGSIWRHLKSGHTYRVIACGLIENDLTPSVIYTNLNPDSDPLSAANWVRPMVDFCDGRFALIATHLSPTAVDGSPAPDAGSKEGL